MVKYIFRIKFEIPILDLMLLPKTVFHLKGYTPVVKQYNIDHRTLTEIGHVLITMEVMWQILMMFI